VEDSGENIKALKRHFFSRSRPRLGFLGIKVIRFKRNIENDRLRLRLLKISDLYVLRSRYQPEQFPGNRVREARLFSSLFSYWRWMNAFFECFYLIEIKAVGKDRMIGFVGLYNLEIGQRLYLSAVLFDLKDRRQGYGRQALTLLFNFLKEAGVSKEVRAEVFRRNASSLAFLKMMGFEVLSDHGDHLLLVKALGQKH
jgi:RimJ/RimL family protein N-acetyltransferase